MFPSADVVEILAYAGLDFVYMDMEHSATTHESLAHMIRALRDRRLDASRAHPRERAGRVPGVICALLDLGAMGVIVAARRHPRRGEGRGRRGEVRRRWARAACSTSDARPGTARA
jgi:2-keto-3-deoxy-L-rhamnonate aldolase RhmA